MLFEGSENIAAQVRDIVLKERALSVSDREWQHRLRGYGYALAETARGRVVTHLRNGRELCWLGDLA
ncbi:hypothetical protein [Mesobacterium pallidum]|uniref:hypothetical protein n=1 Tax=Mesobacterium pallidum TaxID=2872037 RepID=UPI001EE15D51|nr:hypothetical protein [Mesobacterium pallidum]